MAPQQRRLAHKKRQFFIKLVAMATSLEISEKRGPDRSSASRTLSFSEKIAKIGPADPEIIVL